MSTDTKPPSNARAAAAKIASRLSRRPREATADGKPQGLVSQLLELTRHSFIYGVGGIVSRFLAVFLLPVYTRYLSTADYGAVTTLMAGSAVATVVLRAGAGYGFIRFWYDSDEPAYRKRLLRTIFWFQMLMATVGLILCVAFASQIAGWLRLDSPQLGSSGTSLVIATGILLWVNVNYAQLTNLFRAEQRSAAFAVATLANIGITVPLTVLFVAHYGLGPLGLLVGNFSGTLIVFAVLLVYRREQLGLQFDRKLLRAVNRFGLPLVPSALALWVTNFGDRFMLVRLLPASGLHEAGIYALAVNIGAVMVLLFTAFQTAWPAFAYSISEEKDAKRAYAYVLTYLMLIACWAAIGLSLLAPWIVQILAPTKPSFWSASEAVPALAYSSVFYAGFIVVTIGASRTKNTQFNWIAAAAAAIFNFTLNLWLIPAYGMLGAAYATLAAYALLMVVRTWNAQLLYPVPYQWRRVGVVLVAAGALTALGKLLPSSLPLAIGLTVAYPLALGLLGFYLPVERRRLRRLLPAHN